MPLPNFQTLMRPALELHTDGQDWARAALRDALAARFDLTDDERAEMLPSGNQRRFDNRLAWTVTHLSQARLLSRPLRGVTRITERGLQVLQDQPTGVDIAVLQEFPEYQQFRGSGSASGGAEPAAPAAEDATATPEEAIQAAYGQLTGVLAEELLSKVLDCEPVFFEQLVVDLLIAMGYGGSKAEAGERLGQSGDGGIDGVIREDLLGLDVVYLQAKRWDPSRRVGRPEVQAFAGALQGARASKGVFLTTASFSQQATTYVESISARVVLIDGRELARLMILYGVGVTVREHFEIKRLDEDYFVNGLA